MTHGKQREIQLIDIEIAKDLILMLVFNGATYLFALGNSAR